LADLKTRSDNQMDYLNGKLLDWTEVRLINISLRTVLWW